MHNKPIQPTPKTARLMGSVRHKDAMTDLAEIFQDGPPRKGMYLSRVFGIFNEERVRIWAQDPRSPDQVFEKRPTLYDAGKPYTLDFLFLKNVRAFVAEMKCEIRYQNYWFWRFTEPGQLDHHKNNKGFEKKVIASNTHEYRHSFIEEMKWQKSKQNS